MSAAAVAERAEAVFRDLTFAEARRWKERTGGRAFGFMPVYAPRELVHSQGALPVAVLGGGEDLEIIRGDAYYQSYICHIPRSTIELGLSGALDFLDGMIFPATCDVIRNLSGIWKLRFPDRLSFYLDVPQNFDRAVGGAFYRRELESLAEALSAHGARGYDAEALRGSIAAFNENRAVVREIHALRADRPWLVPTSEMYVVLRAGLVLPVEEATALFREYLAGALSAEDRRPMDQARVLLSGSFCEPPPLGLVRTLERSGCYIVDDDLAQVHRWIRGDVPVDGDPLDALVTSFLEDSIESPVRYCAGDAKGSELIERVRRTGAEGVLFCAPSFCDPALLDQPMAIRALEREGIPWTAFKYAENNGQFQVIREQAGTFADSIKLWSGVTP